MIKILASDGMEKSAIAALEAKGCQVDVKFYDPDALCEAVKEYDVLVVRSATKVREPQINTQAPPPPVTVAVEPTKKEDRQEYTGPPVIVPGPPPPPAPPAPPKPSVITNPSWSRQV